VARYDDDAPPTSHPGDNDESAGGHIAYEAENAGNDSSDEGTGHLNSEKTKMCPHYRQLTSESLAKKAHSTLVPDKHKVNCCSMGGEKTKLGAHDIEDLVEFGMQPNVKRGVALYREPLVPSFGLQIGQATGSRGSIAINKVIPGGAGEKEGSIQMGDTLVSVNNLDVTRGYNLGDVTNRIRETNTNEPLLLDVYSGDTNDIDVDEYSDESACPYYLSRALVKGAELVFCPYNYVLDPSIRKALEIDVENAIVVLDEAHNVEDTLRQEGSGKYGEIELLEMNVVLSMYASKWEPRNQRLDSGRRGKEESAHDKMPDAAHDILVFLDKIIDAMSESRNNFENDQGTCTHYHLSCYLICPFCALTELTLFCTFPGRIGATAASEEYRKFKCSDDKEFEMKYFGPSGSGDGKNPIGCKGFFAKVNVEKKEVEHVEAQVGLFHEYMKSKRGGKDQKNTIAADRLYELVTTLCNAFKLSE